LSLAEIIADSKNISDFIYENIINTPKVVAIFKNAYSDNPEIKNNARKILFKLLKHNYNTFKKYGIQQLHFHLPNNESFLRFHRPQKYGDNLTTIRESVRYVNENKKNIIGFEEGKIFNGYRFVYPLFDEMHKHIGSVEISQSLLSFKKKYETLREEYIDFILQKKVVEKKVFKNELTNYNEYTHSKNFFIQKSIYRYNKESEKYVLRDKLLENVFNNEELINKINHLDPIFFIKLYDFEIYNIIFIPLLNDFTHKKVGYKLLISKSLFQEQYIFAHLFNAFIILFLSIFMGIVFSKKEKLKQEHQKSANEYRLITDLSENLILVIEDNVVKTVNQRFRNFFNLATIYDYEIKEIFLLSMIEKEDYLYLNNIKTLFEDLFNNTTKEILLIDNKGTEVIFELSSHKSCGSENYIIELINITNLKSKNIDLQNKVYLDALTQSYNRLYFDNIFDKEFQYMHNKNINLSLVMLDIDYFKVINDEYGHDIGDDALVFLSQLIKGNIREDDVFCRWGGEEFMIIVHDSLNNSIKMSELLRKMIDDRTLENKKIPHFTCSFGVISLKEIKSKREALIKVDELLYKAKESGRNIVISE